jgi:hypothetical protein
LRSEVRDNEHHSGHVRNADGNPIAGAAIEARSPFHCCPISIARADGSGSYTLDDLTPGVYSVRAKAAAFISDLDQQTKQTLIAIETRVEQLGNALASAQGQCRTGSPQACEPWRSL